MLSYFVYITGFLTDRLRRDDRGATMVEYGLMLALIAVVCITVIGLLGTDLKNMFTTVQQAIANA